MVAHSFLYQYNTQDKNINTNNIKDDYQTNVNNQIQTGGVVIQNDFSNIQNQTVTQNKTPVVGFEAPVLQQNPAVFCTNCGQKNIGNNAFCANCGNKL